MSESLLERTQGERRISSFPEGSPVPWRCPNKVVIVRTGRRVKYEWVKPEETQASKTNEGFAVETKQPIIQNPKHCSLSVSTQSLVSSTSRVPEVHELQTFRN